MNWMLILLLLAAAGQPALAQESRGSSGYAQQPMLLPPKPALDAEEAFRAGNRQPLPTPGCDRAAEKCRRLAKYVEEYNLTLQALQRKYPQ
jgi:hypothetical protein